MTLTPAVAFAFGGGELSVEVRLDASPALCRISWVRWETEWPWRFTTMEPYANTTTLTFPRRKLEVWLDRQMDVLTAAVWASAIEDRVGQAVSYLQGHLGDNPPPTHEGSELTAVEKFSGPL